MKFTLPDPPTNPITAAIPLLIVIIVTAIKQGYEDILRHVSDNNVNNKKSLVFKKNKFVECNWKDIKCGDIVKVDVNEPFPCDLLLLYSESETRTCHITTTDLDGETNLKTRNDILLDSSIISNMESLEGVIVCDKPNSNLYDFNGQLTINDQKM